MRFLNNGLLIGTLLAAVAQVSLAQSPPTDSPLAPLPVGVAKGDSPDAAPGSPPGTAPNLEVYLAQVENLRHQQVALQTRAVPTDEEKKQIELMQKQIDTMEKMIKLLAEQVKQQAPGGAQVEKLQTQAASLEARSVQAARRDRELADAVDDLRAHADAQERWGPSLPAPLKELFLPSGTNESPLSIYGALAFGFSKFLGDPYSAANGVGRPSTPGGFYFGEFTPDFLLKLNDWILLEAEIGIGADGSVSAGSFAQADFFVNDWLTMIVGRFVVPIGWFNERLNNPWINKLPGDAPGSAPLTSLQVLPVLSALGVEAQGSFYLGCSPLKLEYAAYISNGMNVVPATPGAPTVDELANLENMQNTFSIVSNSKAVGGRLGLWWPEMGLEAGLSGMYNGNYVVGFDDTISLWAVDFNFHKGNWDVRAEYGMTSQQTGSFVGTPGLTDTKICRQGFYGQVAYRPYDCPTKCIRNTELVYRYAYVNVTGVDPTTLDLTTYSTPVDVPTRRQQNEIGINYYFYQRMVWKCAYQINDEPGFHLHDNQFITELAWGW